MKDRIKRRHGVKIGAFCAVTFLLTGCVGQDPVDSLHDSLEKVADLEKPFQEEQKTLEELEKKNMLSTMMSSSSIWMIIKKSFHYQTKR